MNEKIKELALQAGYEPDMFGIGHWDMPECKKFAELIVRETIKIIQATSAESIDLDRPLAENVVWTVNNIKQHFGIE